MVGNVRRGGKRRCINTTTCCLGEVAGSRLSVAGASVVGNVARGSRDCTGTTTCGSPGGEGGVQTAVCR